MSTDARDDHRAGRGAAARRVGAVATRAVVPRGLLGADVARLDRVELPVPAPVPRLDGPRRGQAREPARRRRRAACPYLNFVGAGAARDDRDADRRRTRRCGRSSRRSSGRGSYWTAVATPITPRDLVAAKLTWVAHPRRDGGRALLARCSRPSTRCSARGRCCCRSRACSPGSPTPRRSPRSRRPRRTRTPSPFLPLRDHPDVPVLGRLLPDQPAAGMAPGRRAVRAAVPRRRAVQDPRARAGHARRDRRTTSRSSPRSRPWAPSCASATSAGGWRSDGRRRRLRIVPAGRARVAPVRCTCSSATR